MRLAWKRRRRTKRNDPVAAPASFSPPTSLFLGDKINDNDDEGGCRLPQLSWPNLWTYKESEWRARRRRRWRRSGGYKTSPLGYSPLRAPSLVRTCSARKADDPLTFLKRLLDWRLLRGLGSQSVYTFWRLIKLTPNYTGSSAALVAIDCRRISRH